jgi:hypothetical protein
MIDHPFFCPAEMSDGVAREREREALAAEHWKQVPRVAQFQRYAHFASEHSQ